MRFYAITSDAGTEIRPVQEWLFKKYAPDVKLEWLDVGDTPLCLWCKAVRDCLRMVSQKRIVLLLDDHLLIDKMGNMLADHGYDRIELGTINGNHKGLKETDYHLVPYDEKTPYSVSTQPSIWNVEKLTQILEQVDGSPWDFESTGRCKAAIVSNHIMRVIEESAISKRQKGRINLAGMRKEDIDSLVNLKLIDPELIVYGWKGNQNRTKQSYGTKYADYYAD